MLKARGFSLIELMTAITIMAIGATLAAPAVSAMVTNYRVRGTAESILAGINYARSEAVRRNTPVKFTLVPDGSAWTISQVSPATTLQSRSNVDASGTTVTVTGSAMAVTFLPTGLVQSGTQLGQVTVSGTVGGTKSRRINIFGGGLIRMCDPEATRAGDPRRC